MPIITSPDEYLENDLYVDLHRSTGHALYLKVEGLNLAGSIKLKAAVEMVDAAERSGLLRPGATIVESSSGNLGVALSTIAAHRGYAFVCVTDARCNVATVRMMEALGARVHLITQPDPVSGFLGARLTYLRQLVASDERHVWLNQYANVDNWGAHYRRTAPAIAARFPQLDVLFLGAGTCGTLMGCARWFRSWHRPVHIVAVDAVGSVTFGGAPLPRMIPGLGSAVPSTVLDVDLLDEIVHVDERDTLRACHQLAREGFLFGGSTGTVVSAAQRWMAAYGRDLTAVAVAPDLGERYLDTIYRPDWVAAVFGDLGAPVAVGAEAGSA